jgi:hypothetical protein
VLKHVSLTALLLGAALTLTAHGQMGPQTMPPMGSQPAAQVEGTPTLAVIGPTNQSVMLMAGIEALPHQTVTLEDPHTHASVAYSGVPLISILAQVGAPAGKDVHGKTLSQYVVATGADGYKAVVALAEIEPEFHPGQIIVADAANGKPLDVKEGPLRLVVSEDKHPARCVRNLVKLELKQAQ